MSDVEKGYDSTSVAQAEGTINSINHSPFDQQILAMFAARLSADSGLLCDLGCGPGQVARYLHDRGFPVVGVDLSAGMLKEARKFHPEIRFLKADMKQLPFNDGELAGIIGFFSLCHIPRGEIPSVLAELRRTLRPSGLLLLAFHIGKGTFLRTESWGKPITLRTTLLQSFELQDHLRTAGFRVEGSVERPPDPSCGPRGYLWASRSGDDESKGSFSLREAVLMGGVGDVEEILAVTGVSPDTMFEGYPALHFAAGDGRLEVLDALLRAGATVDKRCWMGGTALFVAVQMGQFAAARRLVEAGADLRLSDGQGTSILHMACFIGRTDIVEWLLQRGIDPKCKNKKGETPARWAARAGFKSLATTLRKLERESGNQGPA